MSQDGYGFLSVLVGYEIAQLFWDDMKLSNVERSTVERNQKKVVRVLRKVFNLRARKRPASSAGGRAAELERLGLHLRRTYFRTKKR